MLPGIHLEANLILLPLIGKFKTLILDLEFRLHLPYNYERMIFFFRNLDY